MPKPPTLVLNRFVLFGSAGAMDLATGRTVSLRVGPLGDTVDQGRRARTAGVVASLRHRSLAPLVDFGPDGRDAWVEAYGASVLPSPRVVSDAERRAPVAVAAAVLDCGGCVVDGSTAEVGVDGHGRLVLVPIPVRTVTLSDDRPSADSGARGATAPVIVTVLQRRDELEQLVDLLEDPRASGPRHVRVWGPPGSGLSTLFESLARDARLRGFVPVSSRVLHRASAWPAAWNPGWVVDTLRHRHVLLLGDPGDAVRRATGEGTGDAAIARLLTELDRRSGRPHLIVSARRQEPLAPHIRLQPFSPPRLRQAVAFRGIAAVTLAAALPEAIRASGGWPGRFVAQLASLVGAEPDAYPERDAQAGTLVAREDPSVTPSRTVGQPDAGAARKEAGWAANDQRAEARRLASRGRHAAAERLLRRALGALRRRARRCEAGCAALELGRLLMARGRYGAAGEIFEDGRRLFDAAGHTTGVVSALVHAGGALIEDGRLTEAEATVRTALVAADETGLPAMADAARLQLARCRFWQGDRDAAARFVAIASETVARWLRPASDVAEHGEEWAFGGGGPAPAAVEWLPPGLTAVPLALGVRAALADRDLGRAARAVAMASQAGISLDPYHAGEVRAMQVIVRSALGDRRAAAQAFSEGMQSARDSHVPVVAITLRAARVEGLIEGGEPAAALRVLARVDRRPHTTAGGLMKRHLDALRARAIQASSPAGGGLSAEGGVDVAAMLQVLRLCQDADDDRSAVADVCTLLHRVLNAASVSTFALGTGGSRLLANAGGRPCDAGMLDRCGITLPVVGPDITAAGPESAALVRYGGTTVGGLTVRWLADHCPDVRRVRALLAATATALGPAVRALADQPPAMAEADGPVGELSGTSAVMVELRRQVARAAAAPYPVLVQGESGTGKELIARAIHAASPRRGRRFCAINCAALSDELFDSELFGHARGAFTGAATDRPGLFEEADGGTLLLDEVGELSPRAQAKLLRAIQEGEVRRIGENHSRRVDVRLVAATNRPLHDEAGAGRFRQDLLFRLDVVRIVVPPLRARSEDIHALAIRFWREAMARTGGKAELAPATLAALVRYQWPGNVRELQNALAALAVQAPRHGRIGPSRLPGVIAGAASRAASEATTLALARRQFEEAYVRTTLARNGGRRGAAAASLGLTRQGLSKIIARLGISANIAAESSAGGAA